MLVKFQYSLPSLHKSSIHLKLCGIWQQRMNFTHFSLKQTVKVTTTVISRCTQLHTHTRLTALFPGLPRWAGTRKVKPIWILLKQERVSGSGISKSARRSRQITTPAPHHSVFLQAGCPSCRPTNSVKALKAPRQMHTVILDKIKHGCPLFW